MMIRMNLSHSTHKRHTAVDSYIKLHAQFAKDSQDFFYRYMYGNIFCNIDGTL